MRLLFLVRKALGDLVHPGLKRFSFGRSVVLGDLKTLLDREVFLVNHPVMLTVRVGPGVTGFPNPVRLCDFGP